MCPKELDSLDCLSIQFNESELKSNQLGTLINFLMQVES